MRRRTVFHLLSVPPHCIPHRVGGGVWTPGRPFLHHPQDKHAANTPKGGEGWGQYHIAVDPSAVQRRDAFRQYIHGKNTAFVGAASSAVHVTAASSTAFECVGEHHITPKRHLLEAIEVRPPNGSISGDTASTARGSEEGAEGKAHIDDSSGSSHASSQVKQKQCEMPVSARRGQRDLQRLQHSVSGYTSAMRQQQLNGEYQRALRILRDILVALQGSVRPKLGGTRGGSHTIPGGRGAFLSEAVRFERLHQLRDTTSRLTTAHFTQVSNGEILEFLDIIGRIVVLAQQPHLTAHAYIVRQAVRALFLKGDTTASASFSALKEPFLGMHYYNLLRVMLTLPSTETVEVLEGTIDSSSSSAVSVSLEEFCVRRLYNAGGDAPLEVAPFLHEIGPFRAVSVITWCMRCAESPLLTGNKGGPRGGIPLTTSSSSSFPPRSALRISFGVGKEYTQRVLSVFSPQVSSEKESASSSSSSKTRGTVTPFRVTDLATLCSAIVFYEITTMEALEVLVQAAPMCAEAVDELSGYQLSCVMLAYATLRYHGDLSQHPISHANSTVSQSEGRRQEGNFFLLLGARAGMLGERLREDDAARVLRALDMTGIEHNGLRCSLESSMRMRGLRHRSLLARG